MKIITVSFFMNMSNEISYAHHSSNSIISFDFKDKKKYFNKIRKAIIQDFKEIIKGSLKSYNGLQYSFAISIIDIEKELVWYKKFKINPINLQYDKRNK